MVVQEASAKLVIVPAVFETITETFIVQPQTTDYQVRSDGTLVQVVIPSISKQISRRVVKTPASTLERIVPAITKQTTRRIVKEPAYVKIVDTNGNVIQTIRPEPAK